MLKKKKNFKLEHAVDTILNLHSPETKEKTILRVICFFVHRLDDSIFFFSFAFEFDLQTFVGVS